jgi:hypothetical protein
VPQTVTAAAIDSLLTAAHAEYLDAMDHGDTIAAELAYRRMDDLLDKRMHIPLPRKP